MRLKEKQLEDVTDNLRKALWALAVDGIEDEKLWSRYAEYLVALMFTKQGQGIQILNERTNKRARSADIYLPEKDIRVEVKTGKRSYGSYVASFGRGRQIKEGKFDCCVFITYDENELREYLIFDREELIEVGEKPRPKCARFKETNPCLFFRCDSLGDLETRLGGDALNIEIEVHRHPDRFKDRWDKILSIGQ